MYEEIKAEIERLKPKLQKVATPDLMEWKSATMTTSSVCSMLDELISFIESLPKPSEDLEKAAEDAVKDWPAYGNMAYAKLFVMGAQWQKEKEREYSPWLSIPGLKDASLEFAQQAKDYEIGGQTWTEDMAVAFTRGAEWQKEQMIPVTALVNESKDFLSLSLSTEEYAKIGRRFKGGDDIEIYIKQDKK